MIVLQTTFHTEIDAMVKAAHAESNRWIEVLTADRTEAVVVFFTREQLADLHAQIGRVIEEEAAQCS